MGTDIHGVFQRRTPQGTWEDIPSNYEQGRHYQLFAVLAGVRNGRGFAGSVYGEPVKPISEPRGLPADFIVANTEDSDDGTSIVDQRPFGEVADDPDFYDFHPCSMDVIDPRRAEFRRTNPELYKGEAEGIWMGDHSHSWLTGAEMLAWLTTAPEVIKCGVVNMEFFKTWDRKTPPEDYCGGVWGRDLRTVEQDEAERMLDLNTISAGGDVAVAEAPATHVRIYWKQGLRDELAYFFEEIARLVNEHGEIRFVFGFDS